MEVSLNIAKDIITKCIPNNLTPILSSKPGIGKSSIVHEIAQEYNLELIDVRLAQCEPQDLLGMPHITDTYATYVPMKTFPVESTPLPEGKDGWLLFLDELRNADIATQQAAYKLILDRMVGEHNLHPKVAIIAASNTEEDNCFVTPMPSALKSRLIHINIALNFNEWLNNYAYPHNIDSRITTFLEYKKEMFYTQHTDSSEESYACPRTWEFAHKLINDEEDLTTPTIKAILAGCLGEGVALEFAAYCQYFNILPKYEDIINNPKKVPEIDRTDVGLIWATVSMLISNFKVKDLGQIVKFMTKNLPEEFQLLFVKDIAKRYPSKIVHREELQPWIAQMSEIII